MPGVQRPFQVGDIVEGNSDFAPYHITIRTRGFRGQVVRRQGDFIDVQVITPTSSRGEIYSVSPQWFQLVTPNRERSNPVSEPKKQAPPKLPASALKRANKKQLEELKEAIKFIKTCPYKGTAIKVELEAQLNRNDSEEYCEDCDGDGEYYHDDTDEYELCISCGGSGRHDSGSGDFGSIEVCREFILNHVPKEARDALIYCQFYYDGSVDSEFTFTLPIDKAHMTVYFVEAFKALADANGGGLNTAGAGMHMAILNDKDGKYNCGDSKNSLKTEYVANFCVSMTPLIPALFFLASPTHESRGLNYRSPVIDGLGGKGRAVAVNHGVFEYRVFETCYQRPLAILDNIIVIAKTLKFYKSGEPIKTGLGVEVGFKEGRGLERFYVTQTHIDVLRNGLEYLKPEYASLSMLSRPRGVSVAQDALQKQEAKLLKEWVVEFESVKVRRRYERIRLYHVGLAQAWDKKKTNPDIDVKQDAKAWVQRNSSASLKGNVKQFIKEKQAERERSNRDFRYSIAC